MIGSMKQKVRANYLKNLKRTSKEKIPEYVGAKLLEGIN